MGPGPPRPAAGGHVRTRAKRVFSGDYVRRKKYSRETRDSLGYSWDLPPRLVGVVHHCADDVDVAEDGADILPAAGRARGRLGHPAQGPPDRLLKLLRGEETISLTAPSGFRCAWKGRHCSWRGAARRLAPAVRHPERPSPHLRPRARASGGHVRRCSRHLTTAPSESAGHCRCAGGLCAPRGGRTRTAAPVSPRPRATARARARPLCTGRDSPGAAR